MKLNLITEKEHLNTSLFDERVVDLKGSFCCEDIFREFSESLEFLDGFGENWDAFHDSLLNLCFCVLRGLQLVIKNSDQIFNLNDFEQHYLLDDLFDLTSGKATQDNGEIIIVRIIMEFNNPSNAERVENYFRKKDCGGNLNIALERNYV